MSHERPQRLTRRTIPLRQTAIHEAGHVAVSLALGLAVNEVTIRRKGDAYGQALGPNPYYGYATTSHRERLSIVRDEAIGCLAGLAAEHVFCGVPLDLDHPHAGQDVANVVFMGRQGWLRPPRGCQFTCDEVWWAWVRDRLLAKAVRLVRRHRSHIERYADALMARTTMTSEEVRSMWRGISELRKG